VIKKHPERQIIIKNKWVSLNNLERTLKDTVISLFENNTFLLRVFNAKYGRSFITRYLESEFSYILI
jgi:hypothetical protein